MLEGPRGGRCLRAEPVPGAQTVIALAALHRLLQDCGVQPAVVQTDRDPCFVGTEGGPSRAVPGRFTLWLWGLGIGHRILPPAKPWRNGAVERFHGAVEHSWQGEPDGLAALVAVYNHDKASLTGHQPYQDRAGFALTRVWEGLARVRVRRRVDPQGKLSVWDRPLRVGQRLAGREVVLTFDADRRLVVVRDQHDAVLTACALPWLTETWLWAGTDEAPQGCDPDGSPTLG